MNLLEEFLEQENIHHFEGNKGIQHLNTVAKAIGYDGNCLLFGSPLEVFLSDNPGACEALIDWIREQEHDWDGQLESKLWAKTPQ